MASNSNMCGSILAFVAVCCWWTIVNGFSPQLRQPSSLSSTSMTTVPATPIIGSRPPAAIRANSLVSLYMSDSEDPEASSKQKKKRPEGEDEDGNDDEASSSPPEDPEVVALKEEIQQLETTLSKTQSSLQYALDQCEEYSKTGYARKVAEMENMRRVRNNMASSSQSSATAGVLRDFLPAYDTLNALGEEYSNDPFGSSYSELTLQKSFASLGVVDYNVEPGEAVNNFRMKVLESEISTDFPADTVIRQVVPGLELDGNVIRAASCVASSGSGDEEATEGGSGDDDNSGEA